MECRDIRVHILQRFQVVENRLNLRHIYARFMAVSNYFVSSSVHQELTASVQRISDARAADKKDIIYGQVFLRSNSLEHPVYIYGQFGHCCRPVRKNGHNKIVALTAWYVSRRPYNLHTTRNIIDRSVEILLPIKTNTIVGFQHKNLVKLKVIVRHIANRFLNI